MATRWLPNTNRTTAAGCKNLRAAITARPLYALDTNAAKPQHKEIHENSGYKRRRNTFRGACPADKAGGKAGGNVGGCAHGAAKRQKPRHKHSRTDKRGRKAFGLGGKGGVCRRLHPRRLRALCHLGAENKVRFDTFRHKQRVQPRRGHFVQRHGGCAFRGGAAKYAFRRLLCRIHLV